MIDKQLGRYQLARRIGQGGMGAVFEARDPDHDRKVAIKVLFPEHAKDLDTAARFFNEARAASIIRHPGIVEVYDWGTSSEDLPYLVMEYLDGAALSDQLFRPERMPLSLALRLGHEIAATLAVAHERGIVHRDLKPDNVMLVKDRTAPGGQRIKLLDFGIAKIAAGTTTSWPEPPKTRVGALMGTPVYMAPEQCRGAECVTDRSDVYSLGVLLYQMLSGRLPFMAGTVAEMLEMHLYRAPYPLELLDDQLPAEITTLVHSMLNKDQAARPSMSYVAARLSPERGAQSAAGTGASGAGPYDDAITEVELPRIFAAEIAAPAHDAQDPAQDREDARPAVPRRRVAAALIGAACGAAAVLLVSLLGGVGRQRAHGGAPVSAQRGEAAFIDRTLLAGKAKSSADDSAKRDAAGTPAPDYLDPPPLSH